MNTICGDRVMAPFKYLVPYGIPNNNRYSGEVLYDLYYNTQL